MSADYVSDGFISFISSGKLSQSATLASAKATDTSYDFLTFLGIAQSLNLSFLPITWDTTKGNIGRGGTAQIGQSSINVGTAFAFKRLSSIDAAWSEAKKVSIFRALMAEISVLGHSSTRDHANINRLEGICWDIDRESEIVWPVLVFEKSQYGDLGNFMERGAGTHLDLTSRLELCVGVAAGLLHLHLNGVIHGDIKPANVLVYENSSRQFVARVTDFGYSTWLSKANDMVLMPRTPYWTAPEWHHRPVTNASAVKMDIYSYGLLCLWLLFYNGEETTQRSFHAELESNTMTSTLAHQLVSEMIEITDGQRRNLHQFFDLSMAIDPAERCSSLDQLMRLLKPGSVLESHGPKTLESDWLIFPKFFRVTSSILRLYQANFRVRSHIVTCLEGWISKSSTTTPALQRAAFELSVCYTLGFGVVKDDAKASALLKLAASSQEELMHEIDLVRHEASMSAPRQGVFNETLYQGHASTISATVHYERENGSSAEAALHIRREISDVESVLGLGHRIIQILMSSLCEVLTMQKHWEEARKVYTALLQGNSKILGEIHPDTLLTMSSLASIYRKQKRWQEAELLQNYAMIGCLSGLGVEHGFTFRSMSELARVFQGQGDWDKANRLGKEVLRLTQEALGLRHPETSRISEMLTAFTREQEAWKQQEITAVQYEQSGTNLTLPTTSVDSSLADLPGTHEEIESYSLRMLRVKEELLGKDHPLIGNILMSLARKYRERGRWKEAEEKALEVVEIRKRKNPKHPSTITAMILLGSIYVSQGRWKDAEDIQLQTVDASSEMEVDSSEKLLVMSHLASTYSKQRRLVEAERLQKSIVEANTSRLGRDHLITLNSMATLSATYMKQGRWKDAEVLALHVANSRQASLGPDNPATLAGLGNLVSVHKGQERWEEAESLAIQVVDKKKKILGESHPKTLKSMRDLAIIWHSQTRVREGLDLMLKVVSISKTVLGPEHPDTIRRKQTLDEWGLQNDEHPSVGDDKVATSLPGSHGTGTLVQDETARPSREGTEPTKVTDFAVNHKIFAGIRKRRREVLNSFEKQFASRTPSDSVPQAFDRKARLLRDLLIEYGVDQ